MIRIISITNSNLRSMAEEGIPLRLSAICLILFFCLSSSSALSDEEKAVTPIASTWYEELAAQGDVDAKFSLGMMSETGWSVPVDLKKAVRWYREAAQDGHAEAQLRLGMLYYLGLGSNQSKLKGESWVRKAAKQGNKFAESLNNQLFDVAHSDSIDTVKILRDARKVYLEDERKAVPALERSIKLAKQKSEIQEREKAETTIRERREERKQQQVVVEAKRPNDVVSKKVPVKEKKTERIESVVPEFVEKESVQENRTLAQGNIETIRLQAKQGQASAQYNLGRMYELGIKIPVDKKEALGWYEKAAAQGYPDAEYRLAIALLYGIGVEKDDSLGRSWLASAAKHGHQVAGNLMQKITKDTGVLRSGQSIVVDWYLERAIVGDAESALRLGKIYEYGWGALPDTNEAAKWYQKAIMLGSKEANELLQKLSANLAQGGNVTAQRQGGLITKSTLPSNWIAYLIAILVAGFIFFSPALLKKQKQRQESDSLALEKANYHREEPPFNV